MTSLEPILPSPRLLAPLWQEMSAVPPLNRQEVQVWSYSLQATPEQVRSLCDLLSPEERARGNRFLFPDLRRKHRVAHGILRLLLGQALQMPPSALRFEQGPRGKPHLSPPCPLHFNLSHSGEEALLAMDLRGPLGVDLETVGRTRSLEGLTRHSFAPEEQAQWQALPEALKVEGFYAGWTRKEAFIKALGEGMYRPLSSFVVNLDPREPCTLRLTRPDPAERDAWMLVELPGRPEAAAICLQPGDVQLRTFRLSPEALLQPR